MKNKIAIISSLLCVFHISYANASECIGPDCIPTWFDTFDDSEQISGASHHSSQPQISFHSNPNQMHQVKLLSIKPVPSDNRPPIWDGTTGVYKPRAFDKTVDWRDGVPLWDDSISSYTDKDFSDWFLQPMDELYLRDTNVTNNVAITDMYADTMDSAAETRARVEDLLNPSRPKNSLWTTDKIIESNSKPLFSQRITIPAPRPEYVAQDMSTVIKNAFGAPSDGCPFETETECEIWRRKPIIRETVSPRSPKIRDDNMNEFITKAKCNSKLRADAPVSAPLLERYKMLMNSARACCTDGMAYSLRTAGATPDLIYKFMSDDANFYGFGSRCLMMTDDELDKNYPNTATAAVAADVRNGCLCRGRQWFQAMLAPFKYVYQTVPEFKNQKFYYTYTDGLQREITVSVNTDVQNVLNQLALCP